MKGAEKEKKGARLGCAPGPHTGCTLRGIQTRALLGTPGRLDRGVPRRTCVGSGRGSGVAGNTSTVNEILTRIFETLNQPVPEFLEAVRPIPRVLKYTHYDDECMINMCTRNYHSYSH